MFLSDEMISFFAIIANPTSFFLLRIFCIRNHFWICSYNLAIVIASFIVFISQIRSALEIIGVVKYVNLFKAISCNISSLLSRINGSVFESYSQVKKSMVLLRHASIRHVKLVSSEDCLRVVNSQSNCALCLVSAYK